MLVLTRKSGETIHVGDDIVLKVSEISGNRVKIAIDAPQVMRILRGEVAEQIEAASLQERKKLAHSRLRMKADSRGDMVSVANPA